MFVGRCEARRGGACPGAPTYTWAVATDRAILDAPGPPTGLVYERGANLDDRWREHGEAVWLAPLDASVVEVDMRKGAADQTLDKSGVLLLPAGARYRVRPASSVVELVTIIFHHAGRELAAGEYRGKFTVAQIDALLGVPAVLPRTNWINEVCHRYVFERVVCERHDSMAARFCEVELVKELFYISLERAGRSPRPSLLSEASDITARALELIESRLFEALDGATIARLCGASRSTLLRAFRRDVGSPPSVYLRNRRLDEARLMLKSARYRVGDVATIVGYQTVAAFSHAYRQRFGHAPSAERPDPSASASDSSA